MSLECKYVLSSFTIISIWMEKSQLLTVIPRQDTILEKECMSKDERKHLKKAPFVPNLP